MSMSLGIEIGIVDFDEGSISSIGTRYIETLGRDNARERTWKDDAWGGYTGREIRYEVCFTRFVMRSSICESDRPVQSQRSVA
jgi:hypothetical protein